ncbi:MAG TPA: DUF1800 domain-containing protein, partial [Burkholderiaceae bacterium]|nr:DUF1800 domain-containing protein [Burkholderiaceae bacterium]
GPAARGTLDPDELALLNRLTWGVDSAAVADWQCRSRRDYLQAQLHPDPGPAGLPAAVQAQIEALSLRRKPMLDWVVEMEQRRREADAIADDAAKKAAQQAYQQDLNRLARDAATITVLNALYSPNQLQEQLTWFWFNHFNVHQYKGNLRVMVGDYEAELRKRALGRFRDLLIASATHAAMIRYLDNEQNAANRLNENYAREVMELHTLGVDGGYTQKDVQELARVLTGLGTNFTDRTPALKPAQQALYVRRGATEFNPARHDMGEKLVLGERVAGRGWDEILDQLTRLARHPATARHVSRQLAAYFVADRPAPALVERMSGVFASTDGDIALTLQAMFDAPEFNASLARKFKDPMHYVVSAVRLAYDGKPVRNVAPMLGWLNRLGQGPYNRQTPDGYPLDEPAWASSGQMNTRFEIARAIGSSSAGLFKTEASTDGRSAAADVPAFPQLSNALYHESLASTLGERTREALEAAASPQEWNVLLLSSPEFMYR